MNPDTVLIGELIDVTIDRIAYGGDGVGRYNGLVVFVPFGAPEDRLRVRVTARKKNHIKAKIEEVLDASPLRQEPPCRYFGDCGGCQLQHLEYSAQLQAKKGFISDSLSRIGRIEWAKPIEIVGANALGYRSRARLQIDRKRRRVGFKRAADSSICDVEECAVLVKELNAALRSLRGVVTLGPGEPPASEVEIASGDSQISFEPSFGGLPSGEVTRTVGSTRYAFRPGSFFQGNHSLLELLIREVVSIEHGNLAVDLYCGVGLFTLPLARCFSEVIGVEANPVSADAVRKNFAANGLGNVRVISSLVETALKSMNETAVDLVVLDPPREGAAEALPHLIGLKPERVTYVSCDPVTMARDLRRLIDGGFELTALKGFDLFPQTYHVETVSRLIWRGN
jgi:23S rRNA (uracil1939-C5)-methyltransferase